MRGMLGRILRGVGYLILLICAAAALLSLPRGGIEWRYAGQIVVAFIGGPLLVILIAGAGLAFWRWRRTRDRLALAVSIAAGLGVTACAFTMGGHIAAAQRHDISIDYARLLWPGPLRYDGPEPERFTYDRFEGEPVEMVVYRPTRSASGKKAPVLVYVHGGGWMGGDASARHGDLQWFARQGYIAIGVNYSLSSSKRHLWDVVQPQVACALSFIGKNSDRFGADPQRMVLFGESAGGNLVLNIGGMTHRGALPSRCGGSVPRIAATVSIYPPVDLVALYGHAPSRHFAVAYTGGSPRQFPARYAAVSPLTDVAAPAPPTLILTGLDDSLVPVRDILGYVRRAKAAGQPIELITVPRAGHGFDGIPGSIGHQIVRKATMAFLKRQGLAPAHPTTSKP